MTLLVAGRSGPPVTQVPAACEKVGAAARRRGGAAARRRGGWKNVHKLFWMAVLLDSIYQVIVFKWIYPGQALITAGVLAIVPYVLLRGLVTRIAARGRR